MKAKTAIASKRSELEKITLPQLFEYLEDITAIECRHKRA